MPRSLRAIITLINTSSTPSLAAEQIAWYVWSYFWLVVAIIVAYRLHGLFHLLSMPKLEAAIINQLTHELLQHPYQFYQEQFAGSLANHVRMVALQVPKIIESVIDKLLRPLITVLVAWWTISQVNVLFTFLWIGWFIIFVVQALFVSRRLGGYASKVAACASNIVGSIVDMMSNITAIRTFSSEKSELNRVKQLSANFVQLDQERLLFFLKFFSLQGVLNSLFLGFNLLLLVRGLMHGTISAGDFALILMLNEAIGNITWRMSGDLALLFEMIGSVAKGLEVITLKQKVELIPASKLLIEHGQIEYKNISFAYENKPPLFNNLSVMIAGGQKVGLVGFSGSGKSSFINLLLRFFEVQAGAICIDGQTIAQLNVAALRSKISFIPQDPSLFHRTLYENIAYARPEATYDEVIHAAQRAHVHEFVMQLPDGYQTMVGERGVKLSGGQRQRIAIARAFLKDAPILLLDEATSQLDSITESYIQHSLLQLMHKKTVIVIAHRLSTLLHMDRILVFDQGAIVQDGSHQELLMQKGLYAALWNHQSGGFLPERLERANLQPLGASC